MAKTPTQSGRVLCTRVCHMQMWHCRAILKVLGLIWSKAVEFSETYAMEFFRTDGTQLLADPPAYTLWKASLLEKLKDQTDITNFFMHEHDNNGLVIRWFRNSIFKRFHINFSYNTTPMHMYTLSAMAFTCSLNCVAMG
ncbi:hypothetical protein BKA82DRAFT_4014923 [Pisolithus tinctorius]|nr:hypothetical protein BKA82DRAFT_4014923 [Pisolithus tinctorius]